MLPSYLFTFFNALIDTNGPMQWKYVINAVLYLFISLQANSIFVFYV